MDNSELLWGKASALLRQELSQTGYESWIRPLKPVSLSDGKLTLLAPNALIRDTVVNRYAPLLQRTLDEASGEGEIAPLFVLPSEWTVGGVQPQRKSGSLNPNYTFDSFVVGKSNQFAHAAAMGTANSPGNKYNPLFIYGSTGLGKTHLMHAIGHQILGDNPQAKVLYVTSEQFTNEIISALQNKRNEQFRERYRNVDVLLIDDVQFIVDKPSTVEEFFHTFNALYETNKQIVMTSDKPPKEIAALEERLRSRFEWGLLADIGTPDYETRVAILRNLAQKEGVEIQENGVLEFIAAGVESNIRDLEGRLTRVIAYSALLGRPVSMEVTQEALKSYPTPQPIITPRLIIQNVCHYFDITQEDITSKRRSRDVVRPRHIAMYLIRSLTDTPQQKIAQYFNVNDHTSVIHACKTIGDRITVDTTLKDTVEDIKERVQKRR